MSAAVATSRLSKDYGSGHGLFDLDLDIPESSVFGFLGPNGAGKTTTIRLLMGMIRPTAGSARIFGLDSHQSSVAVKKVTGYLPGELPQFGGLRGKEVVGYIASMRGGKRDPTMIKRTCERLELDLNRPFREYSRGNKQKLGILLAFMHRPRLLILDEPTGGLDPLNQQEFYRLLAEARQEGATVFLSSHILSEVEQVCDRVGIIRQGRLVKLAELKDLHDLRMYRVEMRFPAEVPEAEVRAVEGAESVAREGQILRLTLRGGFGPLLRAVARCEPSAMVSEEPSLEDIFLAYYSESAPVPAPESLAAGA